MSAPKLARWTCPACNTSKLAPTKPRKDDSRRYCFPCSEKSGRLVQRIAPALEKARAERTVKKKLDAADARQRAAERRAAYYTVQGLNLYTEMRTLLRSKVLAGEKGAWLRANVPTLKVRRSKAIYSRLGCAVYSTNTIRINTGPRSTLAQLRGTLAHEVVHLYCGRSAKDKAYGGAHGVRFRNTLRLLVADVYGATVRAEGAAVADVSNDAPKAHFDPCAGDCGIDEDGEVIIEKAS